MEYGEFQIVIGMGYIAENGARYRVVDYWLVDEKHSGGLNPHGIHIFLEHIAESDDRPKKLYPSYY